MANSGEQQLLYSLRSPTTPLNDKLALASSSLSIESASTSSALPQLVRDWLLDTLFKLVRSSSVNAEAALLNRQLWELLRSTVELTHTSSTSTPVLPIYVSLIQVYRDSAQRDEELLKIATKIWSKLAANAVRKATVDTVLDSYEKLVKTSLELYGNDSEQGWASWEELAVVWLKASKSVLVEAAKGGKKVPAHTLALLPHLVPLLASLPSTSALRSTILQTMQVSIFNLDNLRRGLARETYASGSSATPQPSNSSISTADSELLASLSTLTADLRPSLYSVLPSLTRIYLTSLHQHSAALFPLPAKATFPTPSAQKSALEVLGLGKRRELAGRWAKGCVELVGWTTPQVRDAEAADGDKAKGLAGVLVEVEKGDLHRPGQAGEAWDGVLPSVAEGAVARLERLSIAEETRRDAIVEVLSAIHRLEYEVLETKMPRILAVLSRIPSPSEPSSSISTFLSLLLTHHSRSLTMPTLLVLLSEALASSPYTAPNNLLTTFSFTSQLGRTISGMLSSSSSVRSTWVSLLQPVTTALAPVSALPDADGTISESVEESNPSPAKKRKLSTTPVSADAASSLSAAARIRIITTFVSHLPTAALSSLVDSFKTFSEEIVEPNLDHFVRSAVTTDAPDLAHLEETPSKKVKKSKRKSINLLGQNDRVTTPSVMLGVELLEARYAIVARLSRSEVVLGLADEDEWGSIERQRRNGLREVVQKGSGEAVVASTRILLQQLEFAADRHLEDTSETLDAILARLGSSTVSSDWAGHLRGLKNDQVPVALWEMISRRWLGVFETHSTQRQLQQIVTIVTTSIQGEQSTAARDGITQRLLRRADFWELSALQAQLRLALLDLVSLPSLTSPASLLPLLSASTPSKTLSSLTTISTDTLLSCSRAFTRLAGFVPLEYLGREYRSQLAERALSLDLWLSSDRVDIVAGQKEAAQVELRRFVSNMGSVVDHAPQVLARLVQETLPGAKSATLSLYRSLVQTSISTFSDSKSPADLLAFLEVFGDKPMAHLSTRAKKDDILSTGLSCEESAYGLLLELLATNLGEISSVPAQLSDAVRSSFRSASKPFRKALVSVTASRTSMDAFQLRDFLEATRAFWTAKDWLADGAGASDDQDLACADFTQTALSAIVAQLPTSVLRPSALSTCLSMLSLLAYRVKRLRTLSSGDELSTQPFETLLATQLFFRRSFGTAASANFDSNLAKSASVASLLEYTLGLEGLSSAVASAASRADPLASMEVLQATLSMAMILLRDGPEGSVKLSSSALSELLRHLSLLTESVVAQPDADEQATRALVLVATFLDGVCADRPMLLSRLNVSSVLALVSRILQPSPTHAVSSFSASASESASMLLRTLASTVGHVVRHRKDHVVPLFPQLLSTLSAFLSILRRAGFGSTGSMASFDEGEAGIVLGQRAEREARATFPAWAWQGGAKGINQNEAAAVGRLLGSLTAKTAAIHQKSSKNSKSEETGSTGTTTSLAAPLSKHAPFLLLAYLRACVHSTCPIPSTLRGELQGGWFEVMDSMGKWEREALMKGFLGDDEEAERGILRDLWKSWEKERYRG